MLRKIVLKLKQQSHCLPNFKRARHPKNCKRYKNCYGAQRKRPSTVSLCHTSLRTETFTNAMKPIGPVMKRPEGLSKAFTLPSIAHRSFRDPNFNKRRLHLHQRQNLMPLLHEYAESYGSVSYWMSLTFHSLFLRLCSKTI